MSELGYLIKEHKKKYNLTLRDLEDRTGISKSTWGELEKGKKRVPELDTLVKISKELGIPLWQAIEMSGYNLQLPPTTEAIMQRLASLGQTDKDTRELLDLLVKAKPEDRERVLHFLVIRLSEQGK